MRMRWLPALALVFAAVVFLPRAGAQTAEPGWLGLTVQTVTKEMRKEKGLASFGVLVTDVDSGSPAADTLQTGDVITIVGDDPVSSRQDFEARLSALAPGAKLSLSLARGSQTITVEVALGAKPAPVPRAPAFAADGAPLLRLDAGGHQALINDVAFTSDGARLISAGDDKLIRVWDLSTGKTVRTFRGEASEGDSGKVYTMALSPDGKWLAAGGWMDKSTASLPCCGDIRLYDFASGELKTLLRGHTSVVESIAFSPDSKKLISGSGQGDFSAIIWDVDRGVLLHRLSGHTDQVHAVGFTPDGARAVTGSYDNDLRLWRVADGQEIARMHQPEKVRSLAVSSDGTIASGDRAGEIRLWNGETGAFLRTLAHQQTLIGSLSFSPDGKILLSGIAKITADDNPYGANVYDVATGNTLTAYREHDNIVIASAISRDGRWAATGGGANNEIHVWDPRSGAGRKGPDGGTVRLEGTGQQVWAAGFSPGGLEIGWGYTNHGVTSNDYGVSEFALALPKGTQTLGAPRTLDPAAGAAFTRAITSDGEWSLSDRKGGALGYNAILDVMRGGKLVTSIERSSTDGYSHHAYTLTPDGGAIISGGGNGVLIAYDKAGKKLGNYVGHESDIWAVAVSPDGRLLVSGSADQTVRLWNVKTFEPIVTLFRGSDGEWVIYTPQGYFQASENGSKLVTWQVNKGPEHAACAISGEGLYKRMNRPGLVARAIQLASAKAAIAEDKDEAGFDLSALLKDCAPAIRLLGPDDTEQQFGGGRIIVTLALEPNVLRNTTEFDIQVNGRAITQGKRKADWKRAKPKRDTSPEGFEVLAFDIPLGAGPNEVSITASNDAGKGNAVTLNPFHDGPGDLDGFGTLHIIAIGVDKYDGMHGAGYADLQYAGSDARAFAEAAANRMRSEYQEVETALLVNRKAGDGPEIKDPTKANIEAALKRLDGTGAKDAAVIFLAGHGEGEDRAYYFLPTDAARKPGEPAGSGQNMIRWDVIQSALTKAGGRRVIFADTCRPGGSYNVLLISDAPRENFVAFTATQENRPALEDTRLRAGLFTQAVVAGLKGQAADRDRAIRVLSLASYIDTEVQKLSGGRQHPSMWPGRENFILARQ
jgi:WD40 repeat protein